MAKCGTASQNVLIFSKAVAWSDRASEAVRSLGYRIAGTAQTVPAALRQLQDQPVDAILADGIDGVETTLIEFAADRQIAFVVSDLPAEPAIN